MAQTNSQRQKAYRLRNKIKLLDKKINKIDIQKYFAFCDELAKARNELWNLNNQGEKNET